MAITQPKQARARETFERLLSAGQEVLEESGIEGLSSNSVVIRLGLTPPAFYRYFPNKYEFLRELGRRLMAAQNALIIDSDDSPPPNRNAAIEASYEILKQTLAATREFTGGYALMVSLRAIPEISEVRLDSHQEMSTLIATRIRAQQKQRNKAATHPAPLISKAAAQARARLAIELGYSTIEMLYETQNVGEREVLTAAARGIVAVLD